jgi:hypothetical protein
MTEEKTNSGISRCYDWKTDLIKKRDHHDSKLGRNLIMRSRILGQQSEMYPDALSQ